MAVQNNPTIKQAFVLPGSSLLEDSEGTYHPISMDGPICELLNPYKTCEIFTKIRGVDRLKPQISYAQSLPPQVKSTANKSVQVNLSKEATYIGALNHLSVQDLLQRTYALATSRLQKGDYEHNFKRTECKLPLCPEGKYCLFYHSETDGETLTERKATGRKIAKMNREALGKALAELYRDKGVVPLKEIPASSSIVDPSKGKKHTEACFSSVANVQQKQQCIYGANCLFAHTVEQLALARFKNGCYASPLFKSGPCTREGCPEDDLCLHAHGEANHEIHSIKEKLGQMNAEQLQRALLARYQYLLPEK